MAACVAALLLLVVATAPAQPRDASIVDAREALRKKDKPRLAALRAGAIAERHPLAMWVDYWELGNRLDAAQPEELEAFFARWSGAYVEDRMRNDWLLELGKRRDWRNFGGVVPGFRMNDDREVTCYALLVDHLNGKPVRDAALATWLAQRDADDGCNQLASALLEAKVFNAADVWRKARTAFDTNRPRAARAAVALLNPALAINLAELTEQPARWLSNKASSSSRVNAELVTLALIRMAANDSAAAARQLGERWDRALPADLAAWAWASVGREAAQDLHVEASEYFQRAQLRASGDAGASEWSDDTLAWKARAALRAGRGRWQQVVQAVNAMSPNEQRDPAWVYWKARGLLALAPDSQGGEAMTKLARGLLGGIAGPLHFYGVLAAEQLGQPLQLPAAPEPISDDEVDAVARHAGLTRALHLIAIGLRNEGVREWNYSLRGMGDRELLAAAQLACNREVWDRCINTSDRTRAEVDMAQRFPMPFRSEVHEKARATGLDPAYVYGLVRQESRFVMDARSHVGASGLMQLMPATARWTARKIGLDYAPELITDRETNLKLGTNYLKLVLDDFDGSQAMAAAAYNAGPSRPRKWRDGPQLEPAIWAENIPFAETRDYVKKVLSNANLYAALLGASAPSLTARLGAAIGPRSAGVPNKDLP